MPIYNSEKFLAESVESVLQQSYKNIEVIAVDDGSTDNSLEILKKHEGKITVISQKNKGLAGAINSGIKEMRGKWLKWFSGDDILYPDAVEILVNEARNLPDNIVYSNWDVIDEKGKKLRTFLESNYNDLANFDFNVRLLDGQQINVNTCLIPFSLLERGCSIENLDDPVAIDYDFFIRSGILFGTKFHLVSKPLVGYRVHGKQLSHKKILETLSYLSQVRSSVLSRLDKSKREEYLVALEEFSKKKPIQRKTAELGLKIMTRTLPRWATDQILVFYLNKIRTTR
ncbi:glycosyltransferase [Candidatus Nitrosotalea sp. TS]|uniref:glycosyltransferase n=1 Tax=Candidatus Nitrosotalea sp. TS TaxID=2341020 RepID=UPI00140AC8C9|nr:glycosyltransferase [Candidatus Nitrosotalea sp. TS]